MAVTPPICDFGWQAPEFTLKGTDGAMHSLDSLRGKNGTVVAFICNHCPYVMAIMDRLERDARDLQALGVNVVGICSNDAESYPDDSFENMVKLANERNFPFVYLHDDSQTIAKTYDAQCTPDFFGFNADMQLQYRGRLDASRKAAGDPDLRRDLYEAMKQVAETGHGPEKQISSMGCSIKWRA